jgi:hypothetical protein
MIQYKKWLVAVRARDYFDAPGGDEATAAVRSCEAALARFESEALSARARRAHAQRRASTARCRSIERLRRREFGSSEITIDTARAAS